MPDGRFLLRVLAGNLILTLMSATAARAEPGGVEFNRDIRPILAANCFPCHGRDAGQRQAELRLDVADAAYAERDGVAPIKPGDPDGSQVWRRITAADAELRMPPADAKKELTDAEKALVRRWIAEGAEYQKHWAFEPIANPAVPELRDPWIRNPIDRFILARLRREELKPQPAAARETLIRRVSFALTGLPPTLRELDAFLEDRSPYAYENMVDRYLASDRYGEEQARHWLDVARYADTHGLHLDNEREMWAYRDWVIRAFNGNLSFDQFTTWQLAGDLFPDPTRDQRIATGFNRCNVTTSEGGSIKPEWTYRYAVDRTATTVETWMGLTAGCAVCHDHKYDPLSTREFYSLYAFFYSAADPAMDGNVLDTPPFVPVPTPEVQAALDQARQAEQKAERRLDEALAEAKYEDPAEQAVAGGGEESDVRAIEDVIVDETFPHGARVRNTSRNAVQWRLDPEFGTRSGRRVIEMANGGRYEITIDLALIPVVVPVEGQLECWLRVDPYDPPRVFALQLNDGRENRRAVWGDVALLSEESAHEPMGPVPDAGEWVRLSVPLDSLKISAGTRINSLVLLHGGGRVWVDRVAMRGEAGRAEDPRSSFRAWWQLAKGTNPGEITGALREALVAGPRDDLAAEQRDGLLRYFLRHVQRIEESPVADVRRVAESARHERVAVEGTIPGTMVYADLPEPRAAHVMLRGQYDQPGEAVEPGVPAILPPLPAAGEGRRPNRLDLAHWLISPEHPLTARVAVNRIWQQLFGTGLVETSGDFGTRGALPSHPQLLDWLAVHFRDQGWNVKQLIRLMVTSATFRQRAFTSETLSLRDPGNRLLARGPRFRLDAEQLRDNGLFVSGLINLKMGGRGVRPYQPPKIWEPVGYTNSNTRFYMQDHGAALYRRSIYCFLKRTAPPPFMSNFDGPNREQSCTRRQRSNTPLQALQLMNDVQHFEAARALAERVLDEAPESFDARIDRLYRIVLGRRPRDDERARLAATLDAQRALFAEDPPSARSVVQVGESQPRRVAGDVDTAAWTLMANLVLNLDETITRN